MISLRPATTTDLPSLQALFVQTIRQTCTEDYSPAEIAVWTATVNNLERWQTMMKTQYVLVAQSGEHIAGFGTLKDGDYLDFIYVHPDFQGQGVAKQLLSALEAEASKQGTTSISSDISITARPFFERKGYVVLHENQNGHLLPGQKQL